MSLSTERAVPRDVSPEAIHAYLAGSEEAAKKASRLRKLVEDDPVFSREDTPWLSKQSRYERALERIARLETLKRDHDLSDSEMLVLFDAVDESLPSFLHDAVFVPGIEGQGTAEQAATWVPLARKKIVWGCYAQTELGHGSNVGALETTATFLPDSDEIELHTPTLTATKWWPGGLGATANFALVMAQLIVGGKCFGVHAFIVQLRDLQTHEPMPGLAIGDIGPKMGYNATDNGFLQFSFVRIPRQHMLMGHARLDADGTYTPPANPKAVYGTMSLVRAGIVASASRALAKAAVVGVRYSAVRAQFGEDPRRAGHERPVLDYASQQHRVLPALAAAFALHFTGLRMVDLYRRHEALSRTGDWNLLAEMHAASSGLKGRCTFLAADGIETIRRACGGHGYSVFSGLTDHYCSYVGVCAAEGENVLLTQQTTRFLLKRFHRAKSGQENRGPSDPVLGTEYIAAAAGKGLPEAEDALLGDSRASRQPFADPALLGRALERRAAAIVSLLAADLESRVRDGCSLADAWRLELQSVRRASDAHCEVMMFRALRDAAERAPAAGGCASALQRITTVFGLGLCVDGAADLVCAGALAGDAAVAVRRLRRAYADALLALREEAVVLADAFGLSDHYLNSCIGRHDGRVYEALWAAVQRDPANQETVNPGYAKFIEKIVKQDGDPDRLLPPSARRQRHVPLSRL